MFAPAAASSILEGETVHHGRGPAPSGGARAAAPPPGPARLPAVPGYQVLGELGRGTAGVVYKARHLRLNRLVALKVVLDGAYARPEDLVRFLSEAEMLARCQHPNIVLIYEVGWHDGRPYLATELVEGGTLARECGGAARPPRQAAALVEALAGAVDHAHRRGVVHRDLKPANVLLASGGRQPPGDAEPGGLRPPLADCVPKITDFGLAKRLDGGDGLTETGALLGTPGYMAPEQALCLDVGPAADIYALGVLLYELLTGEPPFRGDSLLGLLQRVASEPPRSPRRLCRAVPRDLEAVCLRCLQKEPRDRYGSAAALADELRRFLAGRPVLARPPRAWRRAASWARRHPAVSGFCAGAALGAAASLLSALALP